MKSSVLAVVLLIAPAVAGAQPGAPADPAYLAKLLRSGQIAAEQGKCDTVDAIGRKVAELDPDYQARVYATDAVIATCMEGIDRRQRPPGSFDPAVTEPLPAVQAPTPGGFGRAMGDGVVAEEKSETTALALSLVGTLGSYALIAASAANENSDASGAMATVGALGAWFGPSFGHWYAGKIATSGLGMRAAAAGLGLTAIMWAFAECPLFSEDECHSSVAPAVLLVGAAGLWVGGTISDISSAPARVREYNRNLRASGLAIVPTVSSDGGSVSVAGSF